MKNVKTAVKSGGELLGNVVVATYEDKQELRANATDRDVKDLNRQRVTDAMNVFRAEQTREFSTASQVKRVEKSLAPDVAAKFKEEQAALLAKYQSA